MPRLTDKGFVYTPSFATDIRKRFERMKREQRRKETVRRPVDTVVPIARRKS